MEVEVEAKRIIIKNAIFDETFWAKIQRELKKQKVDASLVIWVAIAKTETKKEPSVIQIGYKSSKDLSKQNLFIESDNKEILTKLAEIIKVI